MIFSTTARESSARARAAEASATFSLPLATATTSASDSLWPLSSITIKRKVKREKVGTSAEYLFAFLLFSLLEAIRHFGRVDPAVGHLGDINLAATQPLARSPGTAYGRFRNGCCRAGDARHP